MQKLLKPFGFLLLLILLCSVVVRVLSGQETLSDYAEKNPGLAYATQSPKNTSTISPKDTATETTTPMTDRLTQTPQPETYSIQTPAKLPAESGNTFSPLAAESADSVHLADGFFYQDLTYEVITAITGISYPVSEAVVPTLSTDAINIVTDKDAASLAVSYDDLCYMNVLHYDFNGEVQIGELICNKKIAGDLLEIFHELYLNEYHIEKIRLIEEYEGDDTASMLDNNTSCFNYRVVDGTTSLSKHAIGCAIDINPFYNPYVVFNKDGNGETYISPEGSEIYADRSQSFPYKIDENDLCYKLFKEHGFVWGGDWNSCKDYQHFQKVVN